MTIKAREFYARVRVGFWLTQATTPQRAKKVLQFRGYGASWQQTWRVMRAQQEPDK